MFSFLLKPFWKAGFIAVGTNTNQTMTMIQHSLLDVANNTPLQREVQ